MEPEEFKKRMSEINSHDNDEETDHKKADMLMCEVLESLGYGEGVEIFKNMPKYYA